MSIDRPRQFIDGKRQRVGTLDVISRGLAPSVNNLSTMVNAGVVSNRYVHTACQFKLPSAPGIAARKAVDRMGRACGDQSKLVR
jgi:hypothetical protein